MSFEYSSPKNLYLPSHVEEELEMAKSLEKRDFQRIRVNAQLGKVSLGALYYQPEEVIDETPIGIVKGYGAARSVYLGLAEAIAKRGRPAFVYRAPRVQPLREQLAQKHLTDPLILQMQAVHAVVKALNMSQQVAEARDGNPVDQIDLGGHSMGNYIMVGMAHHDTVVKPDENVHIRTLTSIAGAGLDADGGIQQLIGHAKQLPDIAIEEIWKGIPHVINSAPKDIKLDALHHLARSIPRTLREGAKIVWSPNVHNRLEEMDIPYGALMPEHDNFFDWKKVLDRSQYLFGNDYQIIENANHIYPNTHPEDFAPHLIAMTHTLARKRRLDQRDAS